MSDHGTTNHPVNLQSTGLPSTVLPDEPAALRHRLEQALLASVDQRRELIAAVVASSPRYLDGWARLGEHGRDVIERYAAFRVGYHRGLDALRANGWRGSGYVRWAQEPNRGFLRALRGLGAAAAEIGETDEAERIRLFILQLDPSGVPTEG